MSKLVSIVLATYKPNVRYLEEQLKSINNQDYTNVEVLIRDDSGDEDSYHLVFSLAKKILTAKKYFIDRNSGNVGSNKTFEILTQNATGYYIAYCDQDDIWETNKISILVDKIQNENSSMCYSDLSIINGDGELVANSFKDINKRLKHHYGDSLFKFLIRRNSVTGCTMLIKSDIAKKSLPFCHEYFIHDHWLALCSSMYGKISYVNTPLVKYRLHGNNQIGASMLKGINTKLDYINKKLVIEINKYNYLLSSYHFNSIQKKQIEELRDWTQNKILFFEKKSISNVYFFIMGIKVDLQLSLFEVVINILPDKILKEVLKRIKKTAV